MACRHSATAESHAACALGARRNGDGLGQCAGTAERWAVRRLRYLIRRLLQAVPVVLGVVVLNFLLLQLAPGDLATVLAGEAGGAPKEYIDQLRQRFGQDQPVLVQLFNYLRNILVSRSRLLVPPERAGAATCSSTGCGRRCC